MNVYEEPDYSQLFAGAPVVVAAEWFGDDVPTCLPIESQQVQMAIRFRREEFAAGRTCARRALAALGVAEFALLSDADRVPLWPPTVVGSITHTGRIPHLYCAAAVSQASSVAGIGIDAELTSPLEDGLQSFVLLPREWAAIRSIPKHERLILCKVIFSAKEAVYKAVYPCFRIALDFKDVEIELNLTDRTFRASSGRVRLPMTECQGRFHVDNRLIVTAVLILRTEFSDAFAKPNVS